MKAKSYEKKIKEAMVNVGTYRKEFDKTIAVMARMYEDMDEARAQFDRSGGNYVVKFVNKNGSTNYVKNPHWLIIEGLQGQVLRYAIELGLTPNGLKKINSMEMSGKKQASKLDLALEKLANG